MAPRTPVVVIGAAGKMGRFACEWLEASDAFRVARRVTSELELARALRESDAPLGLDLTRAGAGFAHGCEMLEAGLRPVIGTSGVDPGQVRELDQLARERGLGGLVVPNFSFGMCLFLALVERAAAHLHEAEIVELHHAAKSDAPSATARETARRIARARSGPTEPATAPPIHSVRLPGLQAHQEVLFGAPGELLTLRHDVTSREAYGPGITLSLEHALTATGVACGLETAFDPPPS